MNAPRDPASLERSIVDRIAAMARAKVEGIEDAAVRSRLRDHWIQRLRRELAYRRLLARLFTAQPDEWVVKGGVALQFRLDPNRPSNDVDLAHVAHGADHAVALRRLRVAVTHDLGDMFAFTIGDPRHIADEDRAITVLVDARIGARVFASFHVDLPRPREDVPHDVVEPHAPPLGIDVLDAMPPLRLIALEQQVADKLCAMFELHGESRTPSGRSRDLGDLAMLAAQRSFDGDDLLASVRAEAMRRRSGLLADGLPDRIELADSQMLEWPESWEKQARSPQFGFEVSLEIVRRFLDPVLDGSARGKSWTFDGGWSSR